MGKRKPDGASPQVSTQVLMGQCSGWCPSGTPGSEGLILTGRSVELSNVPEIKVLETPELFSDRLFPAEEGRKGLQHGAIRACITMWNLSCFGGIQKRSRENKERDLKNWKKIKIPKDKDVEQMVNADSQSTVTD